MTKCILLLWSILMVGRSWAGGPHEANRREAEYYVAAYAQHYGIPLNFVRSIVEQESGWHSCVVSPKGAVGLMQIMPATAQRLGITNRCDVRQNVAGGVRYLAWLKRKFRGDLRLVAAAYYAGENIVERRGLSYRNRAVVSYVAHVQAVYLRQTTADTPKIPLNPRRTKTR